MLGLTIFIYFNYPLKLRQKQGFRIAVLLFHVIGTFSLFMVFVFYRMLTYEWFQWTMSRIATFYYEMTVMMGILFAARIVIKWVYRGIMYGWRTEIPQRAMRIMMDKSVHTIVFLGLTYTIALIGFININFLHRTDYDIHIDKPSAEKELNITLIADTHCGAGTWRFTYDHLLDMIEDTKPDILLIAGDAVDETTGEKDLEYLEGVLNKVHPEYGTFFVYGNHDDYTEDRAAQQMHRMGVTVLEDEMITIGEDIQLIGRLDPGNSPKDLETLTGDLKVDFSKPAIVLQHRPKEFKKLSGKGYDLVMAGHTHGFNFPQGLMLAFTNDLLHGHREYGNMDAVVTSGVSAWGFHYKFPAKSEVVSIHVTFDEEAEE